MKKPWLIYGIIALIVGMLGIDIYLRLQPRVITQTQVIEKHILVPARNELPPPPKALIPAKPPSDAAKATTRIIKPKDDGVKVIALPPVVKDKDGRIISAPQVPPSDLATDSIIVQPEITLDIPAPKPPSRWSGVISAGSNGIDMGIGFDVATADIKVTEANLTLQTMTSQAGLSININLTPSVTFGVGVTKNYQNFLDPTQGAGVALTIGRRW